MSNPSVVEVSTHKAGAVQDIKAMARFNCLSGEVTPLWEESTTIMVRDFVLKGRCTIHPRFYDTAEGFYLLQCGAAAGHGCQNSSAKRCGQGNPDYFPPFRIPRRARKVWNKAFIPAAVNFALLERCDVHLAYRLHKESMRLSPPVLTSLQRVSQVGTGSKALGSGYFKKEPLSHHTHCTATRIPATSLQTDAETFIPDRWLGKDAKFTVNEEAFISFSAGPATMVNMRMVVAYAMQAVKIHLAEGYDTARWEADLTYCFVLQKGSLHVVVTKRTA
ncbi:hypothetical protein B0H19DRAFT_1070359 [Mycena capillaripes]|nr:hypothetical protein B0H19DRAFT_1070359 [Mycena capillaripes]